MAVQARNSAGLMTRGADIALHELTMRLKSEALPMACAGAVFLVTALALWFLLTGPASRTLAFETARTCGMSVVGLGNYRVSVRLRAPNERLLPEMQVDVRKADGTTEVDLPSGAEACRFLKAKPGAGLWLWLRALLAETAGIVAGYFAQRPIRRYYHARGEDAGADKHLRGVQLGTVAELTAMVSSSRNGPGPYKLVGVPVESTMQMRNFSMMGAMGTGKSQAIEELADQVRERGRRAIVYDHTGGMTAKYFRSGRDVILNPFDARSPAWNLFAEISKLPHFQMIAEVLIPPPTGDEGRFWSDSGQGLFVDLCELLKRRGATRSGELYDAVAKCGGPEDLHNLLAGYQSAKYVNPEGKYSADVLSNFARALSPLRYVDSGGAPFSIRRWMTQSSEDDDSWLFLTSSAEMHAAVMPLYATFLNVAILALLNMPESPTEDRIWFFLDEFSSMGPVSSVEMLLTEGRKFGAVSVLGFQNDAQLEKNFGPEGARIIMSNLQNQLVMRVADGQTARIYSENIGESEIDERSESLSFGAEPVKDGSSIATRRADKAVATTGEISTLPDMCGFLKLAGAYPVVKVDFRDRFKKRPNVAPAYVERHGILIEDVVPEDHVAAPEHTPVKEPGTPGSLRPMDATPEDDSSDPWADKTVPLPAVSKRYEPIGPAILGDIEL